MVVRHGSGMIGHFACLWYIKKVVRQNGNSLQHHINQTWRALKGAEAQYLVGDDLRLQKKLELLLEKKEEYWWK